MDVAGAFTVRKKLEEGQSHKASSEKQALPNAAFVQKGTQILGDWLGIFGLSVVLQSFDPYSLLEP